MAARFDLGALQKLLGRRRLGIACTPAGWVPGIGTLAEHLLATADVRGLLALEHGLWGELQDGVRFGPFVDPYHGRPVFSFYGDSRTFPHHFLTGIEAVVFHVQDVSHRAYTYKQALADTLAAAAETGTAVVILDRPSPLAHLGCRGPVAAQFFPVAIPILPGVTLGELALWLRSRLGLDVELTVIPVKGWRRSGLWSRTRLPWIPPSPNIPALDSAYCYACTGILQATTVSEGRGTCKPFEYFGAPFVDPVSLRRRLRDCRLTGVQFREVCFKPAQGKYAGQVCHGLHLMIEDREALEPLRVMFTILQELGRAWPDDVSLQTGFANWLDGAAWTASDLCELDIPACLERFTEQVESFAAQVEPHLLY